MKIPNNYFKYHFLLLRKDQFANYINLINKLRKNGFMNIEQHLEQQNYLYYDIGIEHLYVTSYSPKILVSAYPYESQGIMIDWKKTKRLQSGSFLTLTTTKLENFIFAQVLDRPNESRHDQRIFFTIKLINTQLYDYLDKINQYISQKDQLIIIENSMFYEIYHSFLTCLQQKEQDSFPFRDQIILNSQTTPKNQKQYNLIDLEDHLSLLYQRNRINLNKILDHSQQEAILAALNNKIALIQGPPGTGKTYCGALAVNLLQLRVKFIFYKMKQYCKTKINKNQFQLSVKQIMHLINFFHIL